MKEENIEQILNRLGSGDIPPDVHKIAEETSQQFAKSLTPPRQHTFWRDVLQSRITKVAAVAVILIGLIVWLQRPGTLLPSAYALQDTIEAENSIRFLHIKAASTVCQQTQTAELWLQYDEHGNVVRIRFQSPFAEDSVGPLVVVGNFDESQAWLARFNLLVTGYGNPGSILGFDVSTIDPKFLIERLHEQQGQGEIVLDIDEPTEKNEPIAVTVTYPEDHRSHEYKKVLYIDQATKLVTSIEKFKLENGQYQHKKTLEFFDYNQQIDPMMFSLEGEVPADAKVIEMPEDAEAGLPQDNMTDEQIAVEVTRQFFEAVIDKDFDKAGLLYNAAPGFMIEQAFMGANLLEITSLGEARRESDPDSDGMICSCKALAEFGGQYYEVDNWMIRVIRISRDSDQWMITGSSTTVNPVTGKISISKDNANLDAVTYDGLKPGEFMLKWLVLEPIRIEVRGDTLFPSEETQKIEFAADKIDVAQFEPEVTIGDKDYEWLVLECDYGTINLTSEYEDWYLVTYAWAQINMPEEKQGVLGIGSDDSVKVWLNGELVHKNWICRGVGIDNDRVRVSFKKGMNQLVLKIQNRGGPWGFCCRLLDEPAVCAGRITVSREEVDPNTVIYDGLEPGEFMKKWLVLGPLLCPVQTDVYFASKEGQRFAFDTDPLDFLNFIPKVRIDNTDYEWALLESEYSVVDLNELQEERGFYIAYVWAQIDMPENRTGTLGIGSDDGVKVWLNGELVHENWLHRGVVSDNDRVPVNFKKGKNQLVLKIQNALGPWGFCCRLLEE